MAVHRCNYKRHINSGSTKQGCSSYQIIANDDYSITLLQDFPCDNSYDLHVRERYYIENTPQCINKYIPSRGPNEFARNYYHNRGGKEAMKETRKAYYEANKVKIAAYCKERRARLKNTNTEIL
jgi:hypothetical protein